MKKKIQLLNRPSEPEPEQKPKPERELLVFEISPGIFVLPNGHVIQNRALRND